MLIERGASHRAKVLIVDDEQQVLDSLSDLFRKEFHVFATDDPDEALRLLRDQPIAILLTDQRMPKITGAKLLARAAEVAPCTARVLLTAYSDVQAFVDAINEGHVHCYATKPWQPEDLLRLARKAAQESEQQTERVQILRKLADLNATAGLSVAMASPALPPSFSVEAENKTLRESLTGLEASFEHLRKIQEIIPICMRCGKIKTSESWQSLVDYLMNHQVLVSHGYCPGCNDTLMNEWRRSRESESE